MWKKKMNEELKKIIIEKIIKEQMKLEESVEYILNLLEKEE